MSELKFILFIGGLGSKLQHLGICRISWEKWKNSHSNQSSHIEDDIMESYEQNQKLEKSENPRFSGKENFFLALYSSALGQF
jgi:hypothetical protein